MVTYGLTIDNANEIIQKAKGKKDGYYSFRGVGYRVKDGQATHFATGGRILENFGSFNVEVGRYDYQFNRNEGKVLKQVMTRKRIEESA